MILTLKIFVILLCVLLSGLVIGALVAKDCPAPYKQGVRGNGPTLVCTLIHNLWCVVQGHGVIYMHNMFTYLCYLTPSKHPPAHVNLNA
uniref:Secreted protein n=1 Tax=Pararge aegeria TaxID=116150 RepID=S4P2G5_9NEOP